MAKFIVAVKTHGYYHVEVEASGYDEAKHKAEQAWSEADFGELECIDGKAYSAEDAELSLIHYYS